MSTSTVFEFDVAVFPKNKTRSQTGFWLLTSSKKPQVQGDYVAFDVKFGIQADTENDPSPILARNITMLIRKECLDGHRFVGDLVVINPDDPRMRSFYVICNHCGKKYYVAHD